MPVSALNGGVREDGAFEELYGSYALNVYRYVFAVLGQQADAEDATQQTFLNAYRALRRGERPEQPERWLITIAHNTCRERYRHAQRRPREVSLDEAMTIAGFEDDSPTTAEELKQALLVLPETQRSALVMRELEGRSYAETAAALRISNTALGTLLFRARESLREQLEEPLSCSDAARAISMQLDGTLPSKERRLLRAHLRTCEACGSLARSRRARKRPFRGLLSLPSWMGRLLPNLFGGGASTTGVGAGLAIKAAMVVAVGAVVGGGAYAGRLHVVPLAGSPTAHVRGGSHPMSAARRAGRVGGTSTRIAPFAAATGSDAARPADVGDAPAADPIAPTMGADGTTTDAQGGATTQTSEAGTVDTTPTGTSTSSAPADSGAGTDTSAQSEAPKVPPGQAKKDPTTEATTTPPSGNVPPGQAKKDPTTDATTTPSGNIPPGQAKKDTTTTTTTTDSTTIDSTTTATYTAGASSNVPPGQAKKDAGTSSGSGSTTTSDSTGAADSPGNGKKNGNGH